MGLIGSLMICAGFAVLVDPYYVFGSPLIAGFNALHPRANDQMIAARSHLAERMRPRTLLLGNSRTEAGFDPASPEWPPAMTPVFDAGLPGMGQDAAHRVVEAALAGRRLKHMVIAVEFLDTIGDNGKAAVHPIQMPVPPMQRLSREAHDQFNASLTIGAMADSLQTVLLQRSNATNTTRPDGSADLGEYADYVRQFGGAALFDHKMAEYRARFATYTPPDFSHPETNATFAALMALLAAARTAGCTADIIIYPYHATVLDLFQKDGLWPSFEAFKRALVRVVWARYPGTRIVDFSGYNAFTTEPRPPRGSMQPMRWYWEPGHFRTSLGDQIIQRLYGENSERSDFGRDLRPDTIDAALSAIRQERDAVFAEQRGSP